MIAHAFNGFYQRAMILLTIGWGIVIGGLAFLFPVPDVLNWCWRMTSRFVAYLNQLAWIPEVGHRFLLWWQKGEQASPIAYNGQFWKIWLFWAGLLTLFAVVINFLDLFTGRGFVDGLRNRIPTTGQIPPANTPPAAAANTAGAGGRLSTVATALFRPNFGGFLLMLMILAFALSGPIKEAWTHWSISNDVQGRMDRYSEDGYAIKNPQDAINMLSAWRESIKYKEVSKTARIGSTLVSYCTLNENLLQLEEDPFAGLVSPSDSVTLWQAVNKIEDAGVPGCGKNPMLTPEPVKPHSPGFFRRFFHAMLDHPIKAVWGAQMHAIQAIWYALIAVIKYITSTLFPIVVGAGILYGSWILTGKLTDKGRLPGGVGAVYTLTHYLITISTGVVGIVLMIVAKLWLL